MSRMVFTSFLALVLLCLMLPTTALSAEPAGRVIAVGAGVKAKSADGRLRPLSRRSEVFQGDTIITGRSTVQIRFSDGSLTALRPQTTFKIVDYQWKGKEDGSERGFFSLLKGGLRTISGAIGKRNRKNYQMKTPAATIGIRGTSYFLQLLKNLQLKGGVTQGRIYVWNKAGGRFFKKGQHFFVKSWKFKPIPWSGKKTAKGKPGPQNFGNNGFTPPHNTDPLVQPSYTTSGPQTGGGGYGFTYTPP